MSNHGTPSEDFGWYFQFQADVLSQLPRPGEISKETASNWHGDRSTMKERLKHALCRENTELRFPTWKIINLGTERSVGNLSRVITNNGFKISDSATDALKNITLSPVGTKIELVKVSLRDLGFNKAIDRRNIYARATTLGLDLVPPEVALQLRGQYPDQPYGECLYIGTEALTCTMECTSARGRCFSDYKVLLIVERDDKGPVVDTVLPDALYSPDSELRWVFAHRTSN